MSVWSEWQHRWFGWWRESGEGPPVGVSIFDYVDTAWAGPETPRVLQYLRNAPVYMALVCLRDECVFGGGACRDAYTLEDREWMTKVIRADGVFIWMDDLAHYVHRHNVRLPDAFMEHIRRQNYVPPVEHGMSNGDIERIMATIPVSPWSLWDRFLSYVKEQGHLTLWRWLRGVPQPRISKRDAKWIAARELQVRGWQPEKNFRISRVQEAAGQYFVYCRRRKPYPPDAFGLCVTIDAEEGSVLAVDEIEPG